MRYSKLILFTLALIYTAVGFTQGTDENEIRKILTDQQQAWNSGNIDDFMKGYWKNDSLVYIGRSGVTYGWKKTTDSYKTNYPDTASMGKLTFNLLQVKRLSDTIFFVIGKWNVKRTPGDVGGHFTLIFKKIDHQWVIISDHSS